LGFYGPKTQLKQNLQKVPLQAHKNWHYGTLGMTKKSSGGEVGKQI
jgi:hypothetical protein